MGRMTELGRYFFAIAVAASGLQQLVTGSFVRLVPALPAWIPGQSYWARLTGVALVVIGVAILTGAKSRLAVTALAVMLLGLLLFLHIPQSAANPWAGFMWTNPCKVLALLGGTMLLVPVLPRGIADPLSPGVRALERATRLGPVLLGAFLLLCGIQHFVYADFVTQLVPAWLPQRRLWTFFTGLALIAGGVGVVIPRTARLAASLSGLMIFLWVVLLHIPRALADLGNPGETSGVFEALALSGVAFVLAGTARSSRPEAYPSRRNVVQGMGA
jgi:uncharacterized membrane protein